MSCNKKCIIHFFFLTVSLFTAFTSVEAYSFPFREISPGDPVPEVLLQPFTGEKAISFSELKGRPFITIFWGADLPAKEKRSIQTLQDIQSLLPFFQQREIRLISVNIQGDGPDIIKGVFSASKSSFPIFLDQKKQAYENLGIYVMPAILLVDREGKVRSGLGYSPDMVERLKGEVKIMLGEKSKEQVQEDLNPVMEEESLEEKAANQHFNLALVMAKRGLPDTAIREFLKALAVNPEMQQAHIELGCLYLEIGDWGKAEAEIIQGLQALPDSLEGKICRGQILSEKGQQDEAIKEFKALLKEFPELSQVYYHLGKVFEKQGQFGDAMSTMKEAYLLLLKKTVKE